MDEHPTAVKIRAAWNALNDRDFETFMGVIGENVVAHMPPPFGTIRGSKAYLENLKKFDEYAGGTMHVDLETILADDEYAMVFFRGIADHGANHQDLRFVLAGEVDAEGRLEQIWYLTENEPSHEEFWSE
jgi:hypothetical protein